MNAYQADLSRTVLHAKTLNSTKREGKLSTYAYLDHAKILLDYILINKK